MMTSLSESARVNSTHDWASAGMPARLLGECKPEVARLEFYSLDGPEPAAAEVKADGAEQLLRDEIAALNGQLGLQAEQIAVEVERARSEAKAEARREWEEELQEKIATERSGVLKACEEFRRDRVRYFAGVEAEVVKLALAIAARVLHREAKLDPLLLAGVVRVALEKVAEGSTGVLRVPVGEVEGWRKILAEEQGCSVQLKGDERLQAGECVLETSVGHVELGASAQLEEIERGFFDLLQKRPV